MNINFNAIEYHLSTQLHTIIRTYSKDHRPLSVYSTRIDLKDPVYEEIEPCLLSHISVSAPICVCINENIVYGLVTAGDFFYVIGPIYNTEGIELKHHLAGISYPDDSFTLFPRHSLSAIISNLLLIHNLFHKEQLTLPEVYLANNLSEEMKSTVYSQFSQLIFINREYGKQHNPYEQEQREMLSIESGNLNGLKQAWSEEYSGAFGKLSENEAQNGRYLAIIVVALATRAAIRGGLLPEIALSLGDTYMRRIDEEKNLFNLDSLTKNAEFTLANMVHNEKKRSTAGTPVSDIPVIERCKSYISAHLHEKLTVQDISDELHMHPNYLSSVFKEHEGISLYQYVLDEKINLVKNLLIYSTYTFSEIASYLGFSSQSHLGKVFKKLTGTTLQQYKNKYHQSETWEVHP